MRAANVPEKFRSAPGKISAETIHGIPLRPKDQLSSSMLATLYYIDFSEGISLRTYKIEYIMTMPIAA